MRVLAIRGSNLASLAGDFEVDFDAAPLADAGIFAITGPTGAGKSTLLDAMCLALFDTVPRLGAAARGRIESEGDELSAADPRTILRHGAGEGHAEIDFVARDTMRYRARWTVQRARKRAGGKMQKSVSTLSRIDTAERIGGTKTETLSAIRDLVGLSADQFRRAVLLAQGDFEAFIKAGDNERAMLLERITDSQIYTTLGRAAYEKASALRSVQQQLVERLQAQDVLDDVTRSAVEARRVQAEADEATAAAGLRALEQASKWEVDRATLAERLRISEEEEVRAGSAVADAKPAFEALRRSKLAYTLAQEWALLDGARIRAEETRSIVVADAEAAEAAATGLVTAEASLRTADDALKFETARAELLRPSLDQARTVDRRVSEAEASLRALAGPRAERAAGASASADVYGEAAAAFQAAVEVRDQHATWLAAHRDLARLVAREDEVARMLASIDAAKGGLADLETGRTAANENLRQADEALAEAESRAAEASAVYVPAHERLVQAEEALPVETERRRLLSRMGDISTLRPLLIEWRGEASRVGELEARVAELRSIAAEAAAELPRYTARLALVRDELPSLRLRLDEARRAGALAEAAADEAALHLRALLVDGDPCPVCGATDHRMSTIGTLLGDQLDAQRSRIASLDADVAAGAAADVRLATEIEAMDRQSALRAGEITRLDGELSKRICARDDAAVRVKALARSLDFEASDELLWAEVESALSAIEDQRRLMDAAVEACARARTDEVSARKKRDETRDVLASAVEHRRDAADRVAQAAGAIARTREALEGLTASVGAAFGDAVSWQELESPAQWLAERADSWRVRTLEHAEAVAALPAFEAKLSTLRADAATAAALELAVEDEAGRLQGSLDHWRLERAALLDGRSVADVEAETGRLMAQARLKREEAVDALTNARQRSAAADARREGSAAAMLTALANFERLQQAFDSRLQEFELTKGAVADVVAGGSEVIEAEEKRLDTISAALRDARTGVVQRRADLDLHLGEERPELIGEDLAVALSDASKLLKAAQVELGEATFALRRDDEVRARTAELRAELDREREASRVWLALGDLIGDREGRTFRRFAQGLTLDRLLAHANDRLVDLKPRFALERGAGGDMLIQVVDHDMAGEVRGVHNLSGGERFLVSLALALGLAEMSTGRGLRIESLFIDEGFGALDTSSLGQAIAVLEHLHATGRRVGVISHVEEVKERIPVKIEVTPVSRGTSELVITTG